MAVFISHSDKDKSEFDNIADALTEAGIPHWDPVTMLPGETLSEQLHNAITGSELCIFVATHNSLESAWCGAELGAFWGTGKRVIIYLADSSLKEHPPPQFEGYLLESRIKKVVEAVKKYLPDANALDKHEDRVKIEGEYHTNDSRQYRVEITHLSDNYYRVGNPEWEGVGLFDGEFYYGVYKVSDDAEDEIHGHWGAHRAKFLNAEKRFELFGLELNETQIDCQFDPDAAWVTTTKKK